MPTVMQESKDLEGGKQTVHSKVATSISETLSLVLPLSLSLSNCQTLTEQEPMQYWPRGASKHFDTAKNEKP